MITETTGARAIQWAPSGNALDGIPGQIMQFLSGPGGKTYGYGYGPGTSLVFAHAKGHVQVQPGQWLVRYPDDRVVAVPLDSGWRKQPAVAVEPGGEWVEVDVETTRLPAGVPVEVLSPSGRADILVFKDGLLWVPDFSVYVYWVPTHWRMLPA